MKVKLPEGKLFYSPDFDFYFQYIEEFYDVASDKGWIPDYIYGTSECHGYTYDEIEVARIIDESIIDKCLTHDLASYVAEAFLESLECDCTDCFNVKGIEALQSIIDWFIFWNAGIFRFCDQMGFEFNPRWCIGIDTLKGALETFENDNKHIHVWTYDSKNKIVVEAED